MIAIGLIAGKQSMLKKDLYSEGKKKPASVMVWAGVTYSRLKTPFTFIKGVKINQHVYLHMLKETVHPWVISETEPDGITFQQDSATSHVTKLVQDWCQANFKRFWPKNLWPPALQT